MRHRLCCALLAGLSCLPVSAGAEQIKAKVIGVVDGDTLTVLHVVGDAKIPMRVRLRGIDAPERGQPFGAAAREQLSRLSFDRVAHLDCGPSDRYDRSLCLARVDGVDVGLRLVELGLAWHYKRYAASQQPAEAASYAVSEHAARNARVGLWSAQDTTAPPVAPWEWRR